MKHCHFHLIASLLRVNQTFPWTSDNEFFKQFVLGNLKLACSGFVSTWGDRNRDYFMVDECVRFLCTTCERLQMNEWAWRTIVVSNLSAQVHNKNRTSEPSLKLFVYFIRKEMRDKHLTLTVTASRTTWKRNIQASKRISYHLFPSYFS